MDFLIFGFLDFGIWGFWDFRSRCLITVMDQWATCSLLRVVGGVSIYVYIYIYMCMHIYLYDYPPTHIHTMFMHTHTHAYACNAKGMVESVCEKQ